MAVKRTLSNVTAKMVDAADLVQADKPKVQAGIDTDGRVFQITLPLMVTESDITVSEGKKQDGTIYDKANCCFKFQAKDLTLCIQMEDGTKRFHKIKNNAGPYGSDRYISLGFDPTVYFSTPPESDEDVTDAAGA